jgi:hypothetical protein
MLAGVYPFAEFGITLAREAIEEQIQCMRLGRQHGFPVPAPGPNPRSAGARYGDAQFPNHFTRLARSTGFSRWPSKPAS